MQTILFALLLLNLPQRAASSPLILSFPEDISWKSIFSAGFRPKHIPGLAHKKAECKVQEFTFKRPGKPDFKLESGRLLFEIQSDDSIRIIEHVSRVPISMAKGAKRLKTFQNLFSGELKRGGSVPPLKDEAHGSVAALSDYHAVAESEGYVVFYGFNSSFERAKPLIPVFMIALHRDMNTRWPPTRRTPINPPEGYEWYSLDPKVSTPDPGTAAAAIATMPAGTPPPPTRKTISSRLPGHGEAARGAPLRWWIPLLVVLAGVIAVVVARRAFR